MKYALLVGDGMADWPVPILNNRTPLECARTPNMDRIVAEGTIGLVSTIPSGMQPGSDVANLSLLGYDPARYYSGRAPFEAASMGIPLAAFGNCVPLQPGDHRKRNHDRLLGGSHHHGRSAAHHQRTATEPHDGLDSFLSGCQLSPPDDLPGFSGRRPVHTAS